MNIDLGHWQYDKEFNVDDFFGFVYRVTDTTNGVQYIGKKQFWSVTRKKVKGRKNRKKVIKESKWREYTSSSNHVNAAIEEKGMDKFLFEIETLHVTKGSLYYREVEVQVKENVLREELPCGTKAYYNKQIGSVRFIPPNETLMESKFNSSKTKI